MKLKILFIVNAVILGGSGICAVLFPASVCKIYGVEINSEVMMMAQYAGLGSIATALVAWFSRKVRDTLALKGITLALFLTFTAGAVISIQSTISGVIAFGWLIIVLYLLLAIGYAYFLISGRFTD